MAKRPEATPKIVTTNAPPGDLQESASSGASASSVLNVLPVKSGDLVVIKPVETKK